MAELLSSERPFQQAQLQKFLISNGTHISLVDGALIFDSDLETHHRRRRRKPRAQAHVRTLRKLADFCAQHGLELPP